MTASYSSGIGESASFEPQQPKRCTLREGKDLLLDEFECIDAPSVSPRREEYCSLTNIFPPVGYVCRLIFEPVLIIRNFSGFLFRAVVDGKQVDRVIITRKITQGFKEIRIHPVLHGDSPFGEIRLGTDSFRRGRYHDYVVLPDGGVSASIAQNYGSCPLIRTTDWAFNLGYLGIGYIEGSELQHRTSTVGSCDDVLDYNQRELYIPSFGKDEPPVRYSLWGAPVFGFGRPGGAPPNKVYQSVVGTVLDMNYNRVRVQRITATEVEEIKSFQG